MNYLVGLTGGIGSGKSTVADMFAVLGARIVDTDLISHQLTQPDGAAIPVIREVFGARFINNQGALDRNIMRELVFGDPVEKKRLEDILHPLIFAQSKLQTTLVTQAPYTLVVVPLLFESGRYADWLQRVVNVDCSEEQQITRTMQRGKLDKSSVRAIMDKQLSREDRLRLSDEVILNTGDLVDLNKQVVEMHSRLSTFAIESN